MNKDKNYKAYKAKLNNLEWIGKSINQEGISIKKVLIIPIFLVMLFACQANEDDLVFVGEGEYWSSNVMVYQGNGDETYQIEINYKESNLQDIKNFNYYVKTKNNNVIDFEENDASLNKQGKYQKKLPIANSPATSEKDEVVITVEWNGNSEDFTLTNK